jgi:hypothetical protein
LRLLVTTEVVPEKGGDRMKAISVKQPWASMIARLEQIEKEERKKLWQR